MTNERDETDWPRILLAIAENDDLLEIARQKIEATLIEWRDDRIAVIGRANGLCIKEKDGTPSSVIRFGSETAMQIGLSAIAEFLSAATEAEDQT